MKLKMTCVALSSPLEKKAKLERMGNTIKQVVFDKLSIPSLIYTNWTLNVCTYLSMNEIIINASARVTLRTKLSTGFWLVMKYFVKRLCLLSFQDTHTITQTSSRKAQEREQTIWRATRCLDHHTRFNSLQMTANIISL